MKKVLTIIKKHYVIVGIILISIGFLFAFLSKEQQFISKKISVYENGELIEKEYFELQSKYYWFTLLSSLCNTFGITILVTMFFSHFFEAQERKEFEEQIKKIQENTGTVVIQKMYEGMIDKAFYNTVKDELMDCNLIRKNVTWNYTITCGKKNSMVLDRIIEYTVENISDKIQNEIISIGSFSSTLYEETEIQDIKIKRQSDREYVSILDKTKEDICKEGHSEQINPMQSMQIMKIIRQTFSTPFIYETHFANTPIQDLKIEVSFPDDYEFLLSYKNIVGNQMDITKYPSRIVYKINKALLKGQGFEFYCQKKSTEVLNDTETTSSQKESKSASRVTEKKDSDFQARTSGLYE